MPPEVLSPSAACARSDPAAGANVVARWNRGVLVELKSSGAVGPFTRAAPTYERVGPRQFSYFAEKLVEFVHIDPGSEVLDVATGTGAVLLAAARRSGGKGQFVGVDATPGMLSRAAAEVEVRSLRNVTLREMDGERLDFPECSFDT